MADTTHSAPLRYLTLVLCLGSAVLGCGGSKKPAGPAANSKSASVPGQNPPGTDDALLGPREYPYNGHPVHFSMRLPRDLRPDQLATAGEFLWSEMTEGGQRKLQRPRMRVRIGRSLADGTAESEASREIGRMTEQDFRGLKAGSQTTVSIGQGLQEIPFLRTNFTFTDRVVMKQSASLGPGTGFLYTAVVDGNSIHIDSDELAAGSSGKLEIADAAARTFILLAERRRSPSSVAGLPGKKTMPDPESGRDYKDIPDNQPVVHRREAGDRGPDGWCVAESTRGSFSVKMPGKFFDSMVKSRTTTGGIGVMHTIALKTAGGTEFSVLETEVIGERPPAAGDFVQKMIDEYRKKGAQVKRREITLAGVRADRLSLEAKGVSGEIVLVTVADRDYMLGVQWRPPARAGLTDDVERFFKSFEVKRKPDSTKPADSGAKVS